ncbi:MAG: DapH/DapD/GlmU-related protein [Myxococcota bacterium]
MTESSDISPDANVAPSASVGGFCVIKAGASVATRARLESHVVVSPGVEIGPGARVASFVELPRGVVLGANVVLGAGVVFAEPGIQRVTAARGHEPAVQTRIEDDAVVGAGAIVMRGLFLGRGCVVGAGAMVTRDVADFSIVSGRPARHIGWACICGARLHEDAKHISCTSCGSEYVFFEDELFPVRLVLPEAPADEE